MNAGEAIAWLDSIEPFGIRLGLDRMRALLDRLGTPERALRTLHVAGTNGKGSVCAMIEEVARRHGLRVGLYTSPHLIRFHERIQVDRTPIHDEELAEGLTRIRETVAAWDPPPPTHFEIATALALVHFARAGTDLVALETGLGGRLDATNVVRPVASLITPIDLDHTHHLGPTRAAIAVEKAGIIKPGTPAFSAPQPPEAAVVLADAARARGAPFRVLDEPYPAGRPVALPGEHQRWNAALALAGLRVAIPDLDEETAAAGIASFHWPGRFDLRTPYLLDGAHNPHAIAALVRTWQGVYGTRRRTPIVFGALADKDVPSMLRALAPLARRLLFAPVRSARALGTDRLLEIHRVVNPEIKAETAPTLSEALARARAAAPRAGRACPILVTGSLYLVGETLEHIREPP